MSLFSFISLLVCWVLPQIESSSFIVLPFQLGTNRSNQKTEPTITRTTTIKHQVNSEQKLKVKAERVHQMGILETLSLFSNSFLSQHLFVTLTHTHTHTHTLCGSDFCEVLTHTHLHAHKASKHQAHKHRDPTLALCFVHTCSYATL